MAAGHLPAVDATLQRWFLPTELRHEDLPAVYRAREALERVDPAIWAMSLTAISQYDRSADVPAITVPVSLLAAGHDPVSTPTAMSQLANRLPRGRLHISSAAAHLSPFSEPETLARFLVDSAS